MLGIEGTVIRINDNFVVLTEDGSDVRTGDAPVVCSDNGSPIL